MPIEIRELILRTTIVDGAQTTPTTTSGDTNQAEIIAACTAQVLKILKRERER
jgi:hypothetical protein